MSNYNPARIINRKPTFERYGVIPPQALATVSHILKKHSGNLLLYYMSCENGFAPSAHEIFLHTGIEQGNMIRARRDLIDRQFISFNKEANTLTILWNNIIEAGKVAMMLADAKCPNLRKTLSEGVFNFETTTGRTHKGGYQPGTIGYAIEHYPADKDATPYSLQAIYKRDDDVSVPPLNDEQLRIYDMVCGFTEDEYKLWLETGLPF